jgi:hypothetical protein
MNPRDSANVVPLQLSGYNASAVYLTVERRPIESPDRRPGACPHRNASVLLRLRFVTGVRQGGKVRTHALEHWGCIRECCLRDKADPLGRAEFWHSADLGVSMPKAAEQVDVEWPPWEERDAIVAAVVPKLTAEEQSRADAWGALRLRCRRWDTSCHSRGRARCASCALDRQERRRVDWTRVDRAGAAWQQFRALCAKEPPREAPRYNSMAEGMAATGHYFSAQYDLKLPHFPCSAALVRAAHKVQILLAHPDAGGSAEDAAKVNGARDTLLSLLKA